MLGKSTCFCLLLTVYQLAASWHANYNGHIFSYDKFVCFYFSRFHRKFLLASFSDSSLSLTPKTCNSTPEEAIRLARLQLTTPAAQPVKQWLTLRVGRKHRDETSADSTNVICNVNGRPSNSLWKQDGCHAGPQRSALKHGPWAQEREDPALDYWRSQRPAAPTPCFLHV